MELPLHEIPATLGGELSVLAAQVEAILFLATSPVTEGEIRDVTGVPGSMVSAALKELEERLTRDGHGLVLKRAAGGWLLETAPDFAEVLARFRDTAQKGHVRLTRAAIETAAVIAYNQPVTRGEVEDLRGVRSDGVIARLLSYGLIRLAGRKKSSGSPLLYRTTPKFLELFGLNAIADLPSLEELGELGTGPVEDGFGTEDAAETSEAPKPEETEVPGLIATTPSEINPSLTALKNLV
ncbi:MAG: SMC-Scp complex subunit ScpB [Synergistaceae bacterium]|nr:SMC-Scp complex subunit ScpB [Synergistaceae bacterium]